MERKPNHLGTLEAVMLKNSLHGNPGEHQGTSPTPRDETDFTERGEQRRIKKHQGTSPTPRDETDFTERGEQRRIKKHQGTRSTPDQSRDRSKKILLRTKKQVTLIA